MDVLCDLEGYESEGWPVAWVDRIGDLVAVQGVTLVGHI